MMSSMKEKDEESLLLLEKAKAWDSDGAKLVFRLMKQTGDSITCRSKEISNDIDALLQSTHSAQSRLNNVINDLYLASNNQFIESQVDEEDDPIYDPNIYSSDQTSLHESSFLDPNHVLSCAIRFIAENQVQQSSAEDPISTGKYSHRKLPFIIGSKEFKENDDIGLKENVVDRPTEEQDSKTSVSSNQLLAPPPAPPPPPPPPILTGSSKLIKNDETHESLSHGSSSTTSAFSSSKDEETTSIKEDVPSNIINENDVRPCNLMDALCAEIRSRKDVPLSSKPKDTLKSISKTKSSPLNTEKLKCQENGRDPITITNRNVGRDLLSGEKKSNERCFKKCDTNETDEDVVPCNDVVVGVNRRVKSIFSSDEEDEDLFNSKGLIKTNNTINTWSSSGNTEVDSLEPKSDSLNSAFHKELLSKVNKQNASNKEIKSDKIKTMDSQSCVISRIDNITDDRDSLLKSSINSKSRSIFDETDDEDDLFSRVKSFSKPSSQNYKRRSSTPKEPQNPLSTTVNDTQSQSVQSKAKSLFDDSDEGDDDLFKPKMKSKILPSKSNINKISKKEVEINSQSNDSSSQEPKNSLCVHKTSSSRDIQSVLHSSSANNDSLKKVSNGKKNKNSTSALNSMFDSDDDDFHSLFNSKVQSTNIRIKPQTESVAPIKVTQKVVKDQKSGKTTTNKGNLLENKNKVSLFDDDGEDDIFKSVQAKSTNRKTNARLFDESDDDDDNSLFGGNSKKSLNNLKKGENKELAKPPIFKPSLGEMDNSTTYIPEVNVDPPSIEKKNIIVMSEDNVFKHDKINDNSNTSVVSMNNAVISHVRDDLKGKEIEPSDSEKIPIEEQLSSSLSNSSCSILQMDKNAATRRHVGSDPGKISRSASSPGETSLTKIMPSQLQDQLKQIITKRHSSGIDKDSYSTPKENEGKPSSSLLVGLTKSRPRITSKRRLPSRHRSQPSHNDDNVTDLNLTPGSEVDVKFSKEDILKGKTSSNCVTENNNNSANNIKRENDPYFATPPPLKLFDSSSSEDELFT